MWKKISSKELFKHKRVTLVEDIVELPDGTHTDYLRMVKNGNGATLICRNTEGKILMAKEYSYPTNQILFQFPRGLIESRENPEDGANRELMEEVGLKANSLKLLGTYFDDDRRSDHTMYVYVATDFESKSLPKDAEEEIESEWISEEQVDAMIKNNEICNWPTLAAWALYKANK